MGNSVLLTDSATEQAQECERRVFTVHVTLTTTGTEGTLPFTSLEYHAQKHAGTWHGPAGTAERRWLAHWLLPGEAQPDNEPGQQALQVGVTPGSLSLTFGSVPVVLEPEAAVLLSRMPWEAVGPVLSAVSAWAGLAPVRAARVSVVSEPEDSDWQEVVFALLVDADTPTALRLWDELAAAVDDAKSVLRHDHRRLLSRQLGIHVVWGDDPWGS